ncbi:hypothetical protein [uncultured Corynebacterium sp.]|uniref:hypothetical protein n=1 Tax=uncultured Corynebacterium sp. TaxID=159447 RepID=UPI0025D1B824|nr:hypothetical protein [uncultured Corynebacterium sp.]
MGEWYVRHTPRRTGTTVAVLTVTALTALTVPLLASCNSGRTVPGHAALAVETEAGVTVGATDDPLQQALAQKYGNALSEAGRTVTGATVAAGDRIRQLRDGELTVATGCVGELLDTLDAAKGRELRGLYREARDAGDADSDTWRDITHSTMLSALPTDLQATDPGMAVACGDDSLPQNTVALYRKPTMDRKDRKALNDVAGGVSTRDLYAAAEQDG